MTKERQWVNRLHRSLKTTNIRDWALDSSKPLSKTSDLLEKIHIFCSFWQFFTPFSVFYVQERSTPIALCSVALFLRETGAILLRRYLQKSDHEQITPVALYKRATMSDSLRLLTTKELRARFMSELLFCSQKTSELLEKLMREFPTLSYSIVVCTPGTVNKVSYEVCSKSNLNTLIKWEQLKLG